MRKLTLALPCIGGECFFDDGIALNQGLNGDGERVGLVGGSDLCGCGKAGPEFVVG